MLMMRPAVERVDRATESASARRLYLETIQSAKRRGRPLTLSALIARLERVNMQVDDEFSGAVSDHGCPSDSTPYMSPAESRAVDRLATATTARDGVCSGDTLRVLAETLAHGRGIALSDVLRMEVGEVVALLA